MSTNIKPIIITSISFPPGTSEQYKSDHVNMFFNHNLINMEKHPELGLSVLDLFPQKVSTTNYIT